MQMFLVKVFSVFIAMLSVLWPLNSADKITPAKSDETPLFTAALFSDTHVDCKLPLGQYNISRGTYDLNNASYDFDAFVVSGDITNYGDSESLEAALLNAERKNPVDPSHWVLAPGNHDISHSADIGLTHEQCRQNFISGVNSHTGLGIEKAYYATEVNGYHFAVLADEGEIESELPEDDIFRSFKDTWDKMWITDEQLDFLDDFLDEYSSDDKPVFVVSHNPINGVNGMYEMVPEVWDGAKMGWQSEKVQKILEAHKNVVFISGHVHAGITTNGVADVEKHNVVEQKNGVTYVNLPSYGLVNRVGYMLNGTAVYMEVYEHEIVFRGRHALSSRWLKDTTYTVKY